MSTRPPDDRSILAPFWFGVESVFPVSEDHGHRPVRNFSNSKTLPPGGTSPRETLYGVLAEFVFFGVHFLSILLEFPSPTERYLWIAASALLVGLLALYLVVIYVAHRYHARLGVWLFQEEARSILELVELLPRWAKIVIHGSVIFLYTLARVYILAEAFAGLRSLPAKVYTTVEWADLLPHI
ncbi:hypothetical protein IMZ48_25625 [Candidatus Bathyarchaeota archaeon]|nr:hypothetical protein [Candidatus Bathyarchaeota archaeon]